MTVPGMSMPPGLLGGGAGYADLLAQITSKTLYMDASNAGGVNNNTLATTNFANAGSAGGGSADAASTWKANYQNGLMGVALTNTGGIDHTSSTMPLISGVFGSSDKIYTCWMVARRHTALADTSILFDRAGGLLIPIRLKSDGGFSTTHVAQAGTPSVTQTWTGLTHSLDNAFVASAKVTASGVLRVNVNGTAVTPSGGPLSVDGAADPSLRTQVGNYYLDFFEVLVSNDDVGAALQDAFVAALKSKWGIA